MICKFIANAYIVGTNEFITSYEIFASSKRHAEAIADKVYSKDFEGVEVYFKVVFEREL